MKLPNISGIKFYSRVSFDSHLSSLKCLSGAQFCASQNVCFFQVTHVTFHECRAKSAALKYVSNKDFKVSVYKERFITYNLGESDSTICFQHRSLIFFFKLDRSLTKYTPPANRPAHVILWLKRLKCLKG